MEIGVANTVRAEPAARPAGQDALVKVVLSKPAAVFSLPSPEAAAARYRQGRPYAHLVIDEFFDAEVFREISGALVGEEVQFRQGFTDDFQKNKTISTGDAVPPFISALAAKFASSEMLRYLEQMSGLRRLIPDPYYNTDYGYYHIVGAGGVLGSHVDHSRHGSLNIPHVLNLVVYLSQEWDERDGGALCLFDESGRDVVTRIACLGNRAVIFACSPTAYHGVEPIADRASRRRHSLYFAYYSVDAPASTSAVGFPGLQGSVSNLDPSANYSTYFMVPFRSLLRRENWTHLRARLLYLAYLMVPPILVHLAKRILKAFR